MCFRHLIVNTVRRLVNIRQFLFGKGACFNKRSVLSQSVGTQYNRCCQHQQHGGHCQPTPGLFVFQNQSNPFLNPTFTKGHRHHLPQLAFGRERQ